MLVKKEKTFKNKINNEIKKILVVEDDKEFIKSIDRVLNKKYNIDFAVNGEAAIEKVRSNSYCLILMDLHLGEGLNGVQTTKIIKNMSEYRDIPIIAMTEEDKEYFKEVSGTNLFEGLLYKPFELAFLIAMVQNIRMSVDIF